MDKIAALAPEPSVRVHIVPGVQRAAGAASSHELPNGQTESCRLWRQVFSCLASTMGTVPGQQMMNHTLCWLRTRPHTDCGKLWAWQSWVRPCTTARTHKVPKDTKPVVRRKAVLCDHVHTARSDVQSTAYCAASGESCDLCHRTGRPAAYFMCQTMSQTDLSAKAEPTPRELSVRSFRTGNAKMSNMDSRGC